MFTPLSLIIIPLLYIGLLIAQHRNKGSVKLTAAVQALQAPDRHRQLG